MATLGVLKQTTRNAHAAESQISSIDSAKPTPPPPLAKIFNKSEPPFMKTYVRHWASRLQLQMKG